MANSSKGDSIEGENLEGSGFKLKILSIVIVVRVMIESLILVV